MKPAMQAPELGELRGVIAAAREPVLVSSPPSSQTMPFASGGGNISAAAIATLAGDDTAGPGTSLAPDRLTALEDAAAKLSAGLSEDDLAAPPSSAPSKGPGAGEWADVPRGVHGSG